MRDLARGTHPEQLKTMGVDPVAGALLDRLRDRAYPHIAHLGAAAAAFTDQVVVMMGRVAHDVGVITAYQVDALDEPKRLEDLKGPKDGGPADPRVNSVRLDYQVLRGEPALARGNDLGHCAAWSGELVSGAVENFKNGGGIAHGADDTESQT